MFEDSEIRFTSMIESTNDQLDVEYDDCYASFPNFFAKHQDEYAIDSASIKK